MSSPAPTLYPEGVIGAPKDRRGHAAEFSTGLPAGTEVFSADNHISVRQINEIGIDKVMWSSDYPHSESTFGYSERSLVAVVDAVGPEDAVRVVGGNIKNFLGISA
nr:amidohydrolase family protein [Mycolicibacterium vulneris]